MGEILLLWDIDGTLLSTEGASRQALAGALRELHGLEADPNALGFSFGGRTDGWIQRQLLDRWAGGWSPEKAAALAGAYLRRLPLTVGPRGARLFPGVREALAEADTRHWLFPALLTGNLREGAAVKLEAAGLGRALPLVGAFGDDAEDRNALGPIALRRAAEFHGRAFAPARTVILGDTTRDIACARAAGFVAVAVATGADSVTTLAAAQPDLLLPDLVARAPLWDFLEGLRGGMPAGSRDEC